MKAMKGLLNKKKKTVDAGDDTAAQTTTGGETVTGGGGGGKMRFKATPKAAGGGRTTAEEKREKTAGTPERPLVRKKKSKNVEESAEKKSDSAPVQPLVRKKKSSYQAGKTNNPPSKGGDNKKKEEEKDEQQTCLMPVSVSREAGAIVDPEKDVRSATGRDPETMTENQMLNLRACIAQFQAMGVKGLLDEFDTIKGYNLDPFDITSHESNPTKNRYKDIFCIEPSRVKLFDGKEGDYVHANYVRGPPFINQFLTTQGPLEGTVNDFWRLVVQENVGYIFMLCSIIELGKKKCEVYYPENEGETKSYLDVKVTLESKREDAHFINSKFILEAPGKPKRYIYHHYWKNWPDRGVPVTALAGLRLLRHARLTNYSSIVHCSAGVGRTGTLVAIEWLLQKVLTCPPPYDLKEMLRAVRNQRAHAIQTAPQYAYVAFAVFRMLAIKDPTTVPIFMKFSLDMQTHTGVKIDVGVPAAAAAAPAAGP